MAKSDAKIGVGEPALFDGAGGAMEFGQASINFDLVQAGDVCRDRSLDNVTEWCAVMG
jgi:hypothetical protein